MNLTFDKNNCFVAENDSKTFKKRILRCGKGDISPALWSQATVQISFFDDVKTESVDLGKYKANESVDVTIGEGESEFERIVEEILQTMKKEEWCYVRTKLNASKNTVQNGLNCFNSIPDMENEFTGLRFNVLLQSFECQTDFSHIEPERRIELAECHKAKGNVHYNSGLIDRSRQQFLRALQYLTSLDYTTLSSSVVDSANRLMCICHLNLAIGYLKQEQYSLVVEHCDKGLFLEPGNIKGLFRRSQAYIKMGRYSEASADLVCALERDPTNKEVLRSQKLVEKILQKT